MEEENLNKKAWYRALKVFFFAAFIFAQFIGIGAVYGGRTDEMEVATLLGYCALSFVIVSALFWLIARIFRYIACGTPIINLKG